MSSLKMRKRAPRMPESSVRVSVACNGDGAIFLGKAEAFSFYSRNETVDLALSMGEAPRFVETEKGIRVFRREFGVLGGQTGVGNWCWNAYELSGSDAARLLHRAWASHKFSLDGASGNNACRLSDALEAGSLTVTEIALLLGQFGVSA